MVVLSLASYLNQFSVPKYIYFLIVIANSLDKVKQKESFIEAIVSWRSGKD